MLSRFFFFFIKQRKSLTFWRKKRNEFSPVRLHISSFSLWKKISTALGLNMSFARKTLTVNHKVQQNLLILNTHGLTSLRLCAAVTVTHRCRGRWRWRWSGVRVIWARCCSSSSLSWPTRRLIGSITFASWSCLWVRKQNWWHHQEIMNILHTYRQIDRVIDEQRDRQTDR